MHAIAFPVPAGRATDFRSRSILATENKTFLIDAAGSGFIRILLVFIGGNYACMFFEVIGMLLAVFVVRSTQVHRAIRRISRLDD